MLLLWLLTGCCRNVTDPILTEPDLTIAATGDSLQYKWEEIIVDASLPLEKLEISAEADTSNVNIEIDEETLTISPKGEWQGSTNIQLTVSDSCDTESTLDFGVQLGEEVVDVEGSPICKTSFHYDPQGENVEAVYVAGSFNDWNSEEYPLTRQNDGTYKLDLELEAGAHTYKFIEAIPQGTFLETQWNCDPNSDFYQCDQGMSWQNQCTIGASSCNSMVVVEDCRPPSLKLENLSINREAGTIDLDISYEGFYDLQTLDVQLDGSPYSAPSWNGNNKLSMQINDLSTGRHLLTAQVTDTQGGESSSLHIPVWIDSFDWKHGLMYFAFVDRFYNGDTSNDESFGANWETGEYLGGDWAGIIDKLDYLQSLGVTAIWLTAPQNNAEGAFAGKCGMTITAYHGYWPTHPSDLEEHFGDEALLKQLIDQAHQRNIRVLVDWVGNHVHDDHPYHTEHPDWFTGVHLCEENDNWNQAPETCWFAPYLPTINYYRADSMRTMVDDAIDFAKEYNIDGYRVDAVKHIPYAVHYNLQKRIEQEIEHRGVGGNFEFYTVGETFSGDNGLLNSYINPEMLDGQFDFSLYWSILSTLARYESDLYNLEYSYQDSKAVFGDAKMSTFLGNHDVERFISHAALEVNSLYGDGLCPDGSTWRGPAASPDAWEPYARLQLAWTWLLTHDNTALIYYGDEIGLPGYHDPDNRQMMKFDNELNEWESGVLAHVQQLGKARQDYPQIVTGEPAIWWGEPDPDVLAVSRSSEQGYSLTVINRSYEGRTIENGLIWANLPDTGSYIDILTGETFAPTGDNLQISVPAISSRVLIWQP